MKALVFDLYGTVIHLDERPFQRGISRLIRAGRREWIEFLRDVLVVRAFATDADFVAAIFERFPAREGLDPEEARAHALELLARELAAARVEPSAKSILGFLHRRGLALGLLTNSASPFREPFDRLALRESFDRAIFSCDLGAKKPVETSYRAALDSLGVGAAEAMMIGDSLANDVQAPRALGMSALRIGGSGPGSVTRFEDLAWTGGLERGDSVALAKFGQEVRLGDQRGHLVAIRLLPDTQQGRYNLVARVDVRWSDGWDEELYLKRFRHPESAWIEEIARPLHAELGIETNRVEVQPGAEPLLLSRAVTGEKMTAGVPGTELAFEIGRHGASALLLANADLRPRNAFLTRQGGAERLTMVDYEYTLFDRALDLSDLEGRFDPRWLARFSDEELVQRGERRVVSRGAIQRTRRAFIDPRSASPEAIAAFREGWREVHERARTGVSRIEELLRARLAMDPPLVIGTESYRRAFVPLDIADLKERVGLEPDAACDLCF
ncbi:MAG: HAD family hydrolase [Thermoanaerobaculia bacterium]